MDGSVLEAEEVQLAPCLPFFFAYWTLFNKRERILEKRRFLDRSLRVLSSRLLMMRWKSKRRPKSWVIKLLAAS